MCVAAAIAGAAVVGAGASIYAGNKAAGAAEDAANKSNLTQKQQYAQTRADQAPWRTTGASALGNIAKMYGLDTVDANGKTVKGSGKTDFSSFTQSPDYQFAQEQGQQAIDRSAAARFGVLSGAAVKEGQRYATGLATQNFDNYYNKLAGVAGVGQTSTQATDAAGANSANAQTQATLTAGNARASAYSDMGQTIGNTVNGLASSYALSQYLKPPVVAPYKQPYNT